MSELRNVLQGDFDHNHILPFLWLKGESQEIINEYMEKIHSCGIREICLESRPHPQFCKDAYWNDMSFIIQKAKSLDMKLWILDDSHFPTGYANGMIKEKYPELRKQVLVHRVYDAIGPQLQAGFRLANMQDKSEQFLGAVAISKDQRMDVSHHVKDGILTFDVPEGHWKLWLFFLSRKTDVNEDYINMVDKESCDVLLEAVYEPHYEYFKEEFGNTIVGFFSDEPGFMNEKGNKTDSVIGKDMPLPWSKELEKRLVEALGEEYLLKLSALWMEDENSVKVRHLYMDIASTLYRECFDENIASWCKGHGVMHIGHIIEDRDAHARLGVGAGHFFRSMSGQDMAGVDIVINQLVPGIDQGTHFYGRGAWDMEFFTYAVAKLGSSLAHIDPKKQGRCMAEVFGAFGWHEGLKLMKWITDHFLVRGVNYYVPHAFSMADFPDWDCPPHFYAHGHNPQFRHFPKLMEYMGKMSTLLSGGKAKPTAAILYHADAEWTGKFMSIQEPARVLAQHQIDFDFIPADVFSDIKKYKTDTTNGLCINGNMYQCFVIPYAQYIGKEVLDFIRKAKELNFPIYMVNELPSGLYNSDETMGHLDHIQVVQLEGLSEALKRDHNYDVTTSTYEPNLRYYHYEKDNQDYRMFFNEEAKMTIKTKIQGLTGYRIDVLHSNVIPFHEELILEPYESCVIVKEFSDDEFMISESKSEKQCKKLDESWYLQYADAFAYPNFEQGIKLSKLENLQTTHYPNKAGTFRYTKKIQLEKDYKNVLLELSEAYEVAQVFLDDNDAGVCICPPYRFSLKDIAKGEHTLAIEVCNTLDHEQHDYMSLGEMMEPSGLLGEVLLHYEKE